MSKAFDYMQVPLAIVATDLTGIDIPDEGAYFRVARLLGVNGPMTLQAIREVIGENIRVERKLNWRSADEEPLLSLKWVEEWRERAVASRSRLSAAGQASAEKRAKGKQKSNKRSTNDAHTLNSSSTNVEHATILSSSILLKKSEVVPAREFVWPPWAGEQTRKTWEIFRDYRKTEHGERYKSPETEQRAINILGKYFTSGKDCVAALEHSIGKNWLFPVDPSEYKYPSEDKAEGTANAPRKIGWDVKDPTKLSA